MTADQGQRLSLPLTLTACVCVCVFVCAAVDLAAYVAGVGRECVCVSVSDYSSVCYIWRGWIPPRTFVEN